MNHFRIVQSLHKILLYPRTKKTLNKAPNPKKKVIKAIF